MSDIQHLFGHCIRLHVFVEKNGSSSFEMCNFVLALKVAFVSCQNEVQDYVLPIEQHSINLLYSVIFVAVSGPMLLRAPGSAASV